MASFGDHILDTARQIALETARREATHLKWATVTATSPVRIRYDGETAASIVPPQTTAAGLSVGDRVQVIKQHGQAVIVGPSGGHREISDGTNYVRVGDDGRPFVQSQAIFDRDYDVTPNVYVTPIGTLGRATIPTPRTARGEVSITNTSSGVGSATVTFPAGRFSGIPAMGATPNTTNPSTRHASARVTSSASATIHLWTSGAATVGVMWTAVQV